MGILKDLVEKVTGKTIIEEDEEMVEHLAQKGKNDADRIAEIMWQEPHKKDFVEKVDVSPPVEMPTEKEKQEEKGDESR